MKAGADAIEGQIITDVLLPYLPRRWPQSTVRFVVIVSEVTGLILAAMAAAWIRLGSPYALESVVTIIMVSVPALLACNHFTGLYSINMMTRRAIPLLRWLVSWSASMAAIFAVLFFTKSGDDFSRLWVGLWYVLAPLFVLPLRMTLNAYLRRLTKIGALGDYVILVVAGDAQMNGLNTLRETVRPSVLMRDERRSAGTGLSESVQEHLSNADRIVLAFDPDDGTFLADWVAYCRTLNVHVDLAPSISLSMRVYESHRLNSLTVWRLATKPLSESALIVKRSEDLVLASMSLVIALPLMALVALAVRLDSPGPILFRQARHGFNNKPFFVLKFRSMTHEPANQPSAVPQAGRDDPRVTRVGKFIRRTSLDELPQLFNVLRGDMSLVGPRPHAMAHNDEFGRQIEDYVRRHRLKPGITGWAQVNGFRGETETLEKMEGRVAHNLYYIDNWSLALDLQILARTIFVLVHPNAY